ncbi:hypothetical protein DV735_g931, partial [Chaetothyriales sp. CBS 134920]
MKLSLPVIVVLTAAVSALPFNGADITQIERRQVPVTQPAMAQGGVIVPYANPAAKVKMVKRQVPVQEASKATNGNIVPYSSAGGHMPGSQLKQLKASLRENGILGPQKSKKQRKQLSKDGQKRVERNAALERIREQFNPFEVKTQARRPKYDVVSNQEAKTLIGRPGVTRSLGEERRRETLLRELQSRNKVGGLLDRRFGEDDPTLTPEQKAAERFARQNEKKMRKSTAKEDDDDLRLQLDKGMSELYEAMHSYKPPEKTVPSAPSENDPHMDPSRAAMLAGKSREEAEKEYEANIRQMKLDARSQPSTRTKTEDEKAAEQAATLQELERKRLRRMKGDAESSDEEEAAQEDPEADDEVDDAEAFGLRQPEPAEQPKELDVEDEDEFVLDDDLIASEPEKSKQKQAANPDLAYTYPCPQSHSEFLELIKDKQDSDLSTIVQRIRALYHKGLRQENSSKLAQFAQVLLEHIYYRGQNTGLEERRTEFEATEALIRHLHSMAKAQPLEVGNAFRAHLSKISEERPLQLNTGDCIVLTAIGTIFPTSDHFHSVVTPATLTITRYLGQSSVQSLQDLGIGAYCCSLALQYQSLSTRYVPEVINYVVNAIASLAPKPMPAVRKLEPGKPQPLNVALRLSDSSLRITNARTVQKIGDRISLRSLVVEPPTPDPTQALILLHTFIRLSSLLSTLWTSTSAYPELITPIIHALQHLTTLDSHLPPATITLATTTLSKTTSLASASLASRRPLLLHNHRPLAIPMSYPLFIENYNPDRHYDPDRERAELSKLRAEHKKERKGAMRELRKDANFIAREKLREKKEKDEAYEKKFKRLVAEIQGEEGREAKEYEREKKKRKGRF